MQKIHFDSFFYNPKTFSRGRGKGLRGKGRVSLFPARPISLSGRLFDGKKMPTAFSPSYATQEERYSFQLFKKRRSLFYAEANVPLKNHLPRRSPIQSKPVRASHC